MTIDQYDETPKWNVNNFPFDETNLNPKVREKAVEIANQLYADGEPEGDQLYKKATGKAKEWFLELEG